LLSIPVQLHLDDGLAQELLDALSHDTQPILNGELLLDLRLGNPDLGEGSSPSLL
jgi:hypothetical protein